MSKSTKTLPAVKLEPRVNVSSPNPHTFLREVERLVSLGYRIDFTKPITMYMNVFIATLALPEA